MLMVPHHNIADADAKKFRVTDLLKPLNASLIGQENTKDEQDTLVAKHLDTVNQSQMKADNRGWEIILIESVH